MVVSFFCADASNRLILFVEIIHLRNAGCVPWSGDYGELAIGGRFNPVLVEAS